MTEPTYLRLLVCHDCRSIEEIPDYDGPAQYDYYLEYRVAGHKFPNGEPHRGLLARYPEADWAKEANRHAIQAELENMVSPGRGSGLGQPLYDLRDNYKVEAMQCWKRHNRTSNCDDYRHDNKRLWADTKAERKAEHLPTNRNERPNAWLCDFCVVHSLVQQRQRKAKGLYNK